MTSTAAPILPKAMSSNTRDLRTAVIGLGPMGAPIARNLLKAGYQTTVWNRSEEPLEEFRGTKAVIADDPVDIQADVLLSVLPDVDQLRQVLSQGPRPLASALNPGTYLLVMSTSSPFKVRLLAEDLRAQGVVVMDAPMSGGDSGAREGTLSIMVGGSETDFEYVRPLLLTIGSTVLHMGPLGSGSTAKLCNQIVVAGTLAALAESYGLAARAGLDPADLTEVLQGGLADSAVLRLKKSNILGRAYVPGGNATNQLKDLRYAAESAEQAGTTLPIASAATALFAEVVQRGGGRLDHSVVCELFRSDGVLHE
jgi:3-hydroxyisobutyrate dehydrogenase-like beta-hydroxyacid dehydrogenase